MPRTPTRTLTWDELDAIVNAETWRRGSHLCECHVCGKPYGQHMHVLHPDPPHDTLFLQACAPVPGTKFLYIKP